MSKQIEGYIKENLNGEARQTTLEFTHYLKEKNLTFFKDNCDCWKDKIYFWVKYNAECVCFIAIKDPDEPENLWTVWSDESEFYEDYSVSETIKNKAWEYVDSCGNCGSCSGGKQKTVFGKIFDNVCGCTFRVDNPKAVDLPFLKKMVEIRMQELEREVQ